MARPLKSGLDYFSLDVVFDDPVELIQAECGLEGFAILIRLWQKIYANGYYIDWNSDTALLFAQKINADKDKVSSVVNACLLRNLFSRSLYERYGVLTSSGIQKRYLTACVSSKRKSIVMEKAFILVDDRFKKLITEFTQLITEKTPINSGESTQRKGKEIERKVNIEDEEETRAREGEIYQFYNQNISPITPFQSETISQYLDDGLEPELILQVLKDSLGKREKWTWVNKVLKNSFAAGIKTLLQYEAKKREQEEERIEKARDKPQSKQPSFKPAQLGNFEQRKYEDSDFEGVYKEV